MTTKNEISPIPKLGVYEVYPFPVEIEVVRFKVEWLCNSYGIICDLDLTVYCFDERVII